jgi:HSP20 family protein
MTLTISRRTAPTDSQLSRFREEMERTIETMLTEPIIEPKLFRIEGWAPLVDISESDAEFIVRAEMPGLAEADIELSMVGNALLIAGEKRAEEETSGEDWYRCERRFGSFRRIVDLPQTVDPDRASAEMTDGMLTVRVPKRPEIRPRNIPISPAGNAGPSKR